MNADKRRYFLFRGSSKTRQNDHVLVLPVTGNCSSSNPSAAFRARPRPIQRRAEQ